MPLPSEKRVDVVYRWINPAAGAAKLGHASSPDSATLLGSMRCINRYRDNDELRYSLRSVARHAPWLRAIHIVGEGDPPDWLRPGGPIRWIDLKAFMAENGQGLPLNSETQKLYFSKIEDLAERFLCFDDDWFLGNDVAEDDFFERDGTPIQPNIDKRHGGHAPLAWTKSLYDHGLSRLPNRLVKAVRSGGMERKDPIPKMRAILREAGLVAVSEARDARIWLRDVNVAQYEDVLRLILAERPAQYCINDDWSTEASRYGEQMKALRRFFESMYPNPAPWEGSSRADSS